MIFITANIYFVAFQQDYLLNLIPLFLILILFLCYPLDKLLMFSVFLVPFSIPLSSFLKINLDLDLPTEPIFILITLIFLLKCIKYKYFDINFLKHPVTICIFIYLIWRTVTIIPSTYPLVSAKNLVMQLWFIVPFYFLMHLVVKQTKNINKFLWIFLIGFSVIILFVIFSHAAQNFSKHTANFISRPFFSDHTSYGALLAMCIPILFGFFVDKSKKISARIFAFGLFCLFVFAIITSYTRAAWFGLLIAVGFAVVVWLKINMKLFFGSILLVIILFFSFQTQIVMSLERNKQGTSENIGDHVKSMSNIKNDASNLERINRWTCAIRMFEEKPVFGWGAGTYQFNYGPFQKSYEKTIASSNHGENGNAHSDYLGALAETGLIGCLSYLAIVLSVVLISIKTYNKLKSKQLKNLLLSLLCALITYFAHGFMNNFLDRDKIAVLYWTIITIIVFINLNYKELETKENELQVNNIG